MLSKVQLSSFSLGYARKTMMDCFLINNENENIKLHDLHALSFIFLVLPLTVHHNIFLTDWVFEIYCNSSISI